LFRGDVERLHEAKRGWGGRFVLLIRKSPPEKKGWRINMKKTIKSFSKSCRETRIHDIKEGKSEERRGESGDRTKQKRGGSHKNGSSAGRKKKGGDRT